MGPSGAIGDRESLDGLDGVDGIGASGFAGFDRDFGSLDDAVPEPPPAPDLTGRLLSVLSGLLRVHIQIAAREAARDQQRLIRGIVFLVLAGFVGLLALLIGEGLALWGLLQIPLRWSWALAALLLGNLLLAGLFALLGRSALAAPVMPETRALFRRTLGSLFPR